MAHRYIAKPRLPLQRQEGKGIGLSFGNKPYFMCEAHMKIQDMIAVATDYYKNGLA